MKPLIILTICLFAAFSYAQEFMDDVPENYPEDAVENEYEPAPIEEELYTPAEIERQEEEELMDSLPPRLGPVENDEDIIDEY